MLKHLVCDFPQIALITILLLGAALGLAKGGYYATLTTSLNEQNAYANPGHLLYRRRRAPQTYSASSTFSSNTRNPCKRAADPQLCIKPNQGPGGRLSYRGALTAVQGSSYGYGFNPYPLGNG